MDTVDFVVTLIAVQSLIVIALIALSGRLWYVLSAERHENDRLRQDAQSRPRSPHYAEGFEAGQKQGLGGMYRSAMMVGATDDVLAALRTTGRRLLNDRSAFEEPYDTGLAALPLPSAEAGAPGAD